MRRDKPTAWWPTTLVVSALVSLMLACGLLDEQDAKRETTASTPDGDAAAPAAKPPPPKIELVDHPAAAREGPPKPGAVYVSISGKGIVRYEDDGFSDVLEHDFGGASDMVVGLDGHVYATVSYRVYRIDGAKPALVAPKDVMASRLAIGAAGDIWSATADTVGHYTTAWKTYDYTLFGLEKGEFIKSIALDSSERPWATSEAGVHVLETSTWSAVRHPTLVLNRVSSMDILPARDGSMLIGNARSVFRIKSKTDVVLLGDIGSSCGRSRSVHELSNGDVVVDCSDSLVRLDGSGNVFQYESDLEYYGSHIRGSDVDGQDRVWVGTFAGLSIIGPGRSRRLLPSGSVPELVGNVLNLVVVDDGPAVLPVPGPVATGGLTGIMMFNERPAKDVEVMVCPSCNSGRDPGIHYTTTTDESGRFTFEKLPTNTYEVGAKIQSKWIIRFASWDPMVRKGETKDLGQVKLR